MIVAWTALALWPFLAMVFFVTMSVPSALVATIVGGYLFLPEQVRYDLPGLPPLDKTTIPILSALLFASIAASKTPGEDFQKGYFPRNRFVNALLLLLVVGVVGTVLTNGDPLTFQERWRPVKILPGLQTWDLLARYLIVLITLLPFLLGRKYLANEESQLKAVKVLIVLGLAYSLLALFEIRMSPQLNTWIYGFFPHSFGQHIRGGGFRPLVFLNHGLWLAIFFATALLAAVGMARQSTEKGQRALYVFIAFWILMTIALSRSLGALIISLVFLALLTQPQRIVRLGLLFFVAVVLLYPVLRTLGLIPTELILDLANRISPDRARSLAFRLSNEQLMLDHALERPVFGWGGWGRNVAVVMENGRRVVPDGRWTITLAEGGIVRFLSEFGLLCVGVLGVIFSRRTTNLVSVTIAVLLVANLIDLLPNATLTPLTWLWAGALAGMMERAKEPVEMAETSRNGRHRASYSRGQNSEPVYRRQLRQSDSAQ